MKEIVEKMINSLLKRGQKTDSISNEFAEKGVKLQ